MGFKVKGSHKEPYKELICHICKGLFEEPLISLDCNHIFCSDCLRKKGLKHFKCPVDGKEINPLHVNTAIAESIQNKLERIAVKCRNNGCKTKLKLSDIRSHERNDCWYSKFKCSKGCGKLVRKIDEKMHEMVCSMEVFPFSSLDKSLRSASPSSVSSSPAFSPRIPSKEKKAEKNKESQWNITSLNVNPKRGTKKTDCTIQ